MRPKSTKAIDMPCPNRPHGLRWEHKRQTRRGESMNTEPSLNRAGSWMLRKVTDSESLVFCKLLALRSHILETLTLSLQIKQFLVEFENEFSRDVAPFNQLSASRRFN